MRKQSVVLYGPMACGKTRNGPTIAKALGLNRVVDLENVSGMAARGTLYLTNQTLGELQHLRKLGYQLMSYDAAMAKVSAHASS